MRSKTEELIDSLEKVVQLLQAHDVNYWSTELIKSKNYIASGDLRGVEQLLKAYVGLGSFNDFAFSDSHVNQHELLSANHELRFLKEAIYQLANEIRQNQNTS